VAILIVAALAKVTLAQFGFTQTEAATKAATATATIAQESEGDDAPAVAQSQKPANSLDKARAVQGLVSGQAAKTESQIETEGK
jgi:hypothetical protein